MIKVFIYNIFCVIAVVILVEMGIHDTNSSYAAEGMILIIPWGNSTIEVINMQ